MTSKIGSFVGSTSATNAAKVNAGAVFRPNGSSSRVGLVKPISSNCSAVINLYSSLETTMGLSATGIAPEKFIMRAAVACNIVSLLVSESNCLGYLSRESGHKRVPDPPERMTG